MRVLPSPPRPRSAAIALLIALLCACGYTVSGLEGTGNPWPDKHTILVPVLHNPTDEPEVGLIVTQALREEVLRRGHFRLAANRTNADLILTGRVNRFRMESIAADAQGRVTQYRLYLDLHLTLHDEQGQTLREANETRRFDMTARGTPLANEAAKRDGLREVSARWAVDLYDSMVAGF